MPTERDRVKSLMVNGEPVPASDLVVARMIITDGQRYSRSQFVFLLIAVVALVSAVIHGAATGDWPWIQIGTLALVSTSTALRVRVQQRARGWQATYLHGDGHNAA